MAIVTGAKYIDCSRWKGTIADHKSSSPQGIGYHIAHQLAIKGAKVYVGARNREKSQNAIDEMLQSTPSLVHERLVPLAMDLNDFQQVQRTARGILEREERLDILVNNATQ